MKSIFALCIALAIAFSPAQGLLLNTITGAISSVQNSVNNAINTATTTLNTASIIGQILWDNAFGPAWDLFLNNGADYVDTHFGGILNAIGKKRENQLSAQLYQLQIIFGYYAQEFMEMTPVKEFAEQVVRLGGNSIGALLFGQTTVNEVLDVLLLKVLTYMAEISEYASQFLQAALYDAEPTIYNMASTFVYQLENSGVFFKSKVYKLGTLVTDIINKAITSTVGDLEGFDMENLINSLKLKYDELVTDLQDYLSDSVYGLFTGSIKVRDFLRICAGKILDYVKFTFTHASQELLEIYEELKPSIDEVFTLFHQVKTMYLVQSVLWGEFDQLTATFDSHYNSFYTDAMQIGASAVGPLIVGQTTYNEVFTAVMHRFVAYIQEVAQSGIDIFTTGLSDIGPMGEQAVSDLESFLQNTFDYLQNEWSEVGSMFAINHDNFPDLIDYYQSQYNQLVVQLNEMLQGSVVGLLLGTTNSYAIVNNALPLISQYYAEAMQFTANYVSEKLNILYTEFQPLVDQIIPAFIESDFALIQSIVSQIGQQLLSDGGALLSSVVNPSPVA